MCYWEGHEWNTHVYLPNRIVAFGARLWNAAGEVDYPNFLKRYAKAQARVRSQSVPFTRSGDGSLVYLSDSADISLSSKDSSPRYAWRTDGNPPTWDDIAIRDTIHLDQSCVLTIQAFRGREPEGETVFLPVHKVKVVPSLVFGCEVATSGKDDLNFPASLVTDGIGDQLSGFWLAYPNPQTVTIELGKIQSFDRVEVVTFWATGGPTKYRLFISEDGKKFNQIVDFSNNEENATKDGYRHEFAQKRARYVRLEALGGAVFPPTITRINEIRVFKASE